MTIYLGTFLIALATLALEITLARLLSVITWYHLAFFAISTAMLGMTAGATTVYVKPQWFIPERLNQSVARACLGFAGVIPISLIWLCLLPLGFQQTGFTVMSLLAFLAATVACALPFYFSGIAVSAILTKYSLPIGKLYASDLIGAALGCLLVLAGLEVLNAPSLILACGVVGILAAISFGWQMSAGQFRGWAIGLLVILVTAVYFNTSTLYGIRPLVVKERLENPEHISLEKWNSFSRVMVSHQFMGKPQYWGPSSLAPQQEMPQLFMNIDGEAGTTMRKFTVNADIDHLRFDSPNVAYYLRPTGGACIIGVGGGRDLQSAILFGHEKVIGVDVNPIFIELLTGPFKEFAGLATHPAVTLVADEARSFLSRTSDKFAVIQMSLIDTWASTGAGAFSLSENALYTIEAWQVFLSRLTDDGIFTVSRWHNPNHLGETGRVISLAVASLLKLGISEPANHIAMVTAPGLSTLLLSKKPFSEADLTILKEEIGGRLQFALAIVPHQLPKDEVLKEIVSVTSMEELHQVIATKPLKYEPPTDENPYFFNMLRLSHLNLINLSKQGEVGVLYGNLIATLTLVVLILALLVLTLITIVLPLLVKTRQERMNDPWLWWSGAFYFALIGAGFMLVEIGLIQRLSVFLSHPVYALGILLFTIIVSTGVGSFLSERLPLTKSPWLFVSPVVTALAIIVVKLALSEVLSQLITSSMMVKITVSIALIFPLGILMGFFFPTGMRLASAMSIGEAPWYWALNGIFGVLCSAVAVFISIYFGISMNFYVGALCYVGVVGALSVIKHRLSSQCQAYRNEKD